MASPEPDFIDELVQLLASAQAPTRINRARLTRSILYDPEYHTAIIGCAMRIHGEGRQHRVLAQWLKLLQFVAARPTLVEKLMKHVGGRRGGNLDLWQQIPRGYLGDETHDAVVDMLAASGVLRKSGDFIEASARYSVLEQLVARIEADGLFAGERKILERLRSVKVTKVMLGAS